MAILILHYKGCVYQPVAMAIIPETLCNNQLLWRILTSGYEVFHLGRRDAFGIQK